MEALKHIQFYIILYISKKVQNYNNFFSPEINRLLLIVKEGLPRPAYCYNHILDLHLGSINYIFSNHSMLIILLIST